MMKQALTRGTLIMAIGLVGLGLNACEGRDEGTADVDDPTANVDSDENRGVFGEGSCASGERIAVPAEATYAAYFDSTGEQLTPAEVLAGTQDRKMCPFTAEEETTGNPGVCSPNCTLTMGKKTYCVPPPCP